MFPVLPPPYRSHDQGQGMVNSGANPQVNVNNPSNLSNNFTHQVLHYPFTMPNNLLVPQNVQVAPHLGGQFAAPVMAFDNRNTNMQSLLGNPLSFQALACQLTSHNQPLSWNQPQAVLHSNERLTVPSSASHMMPPPMVHGHSCAPNQVAQPGGFLNPGFVIGDCQMRPGIPALNCNTAVVPSNVQLQNQCNLIAQLLNQNMMHLAPVLPQQVPVGGLPRPDQLTTGTHHNQPGCSAGGFQQHFMHVSPPPAVNGHNSCSTVQSHPAAFQNSNYVAGNSQASHGNSYGLPVLTMNQKGSHFAPAASPRSGVLSQQGQSLQEVQKKEQMFKVNTNESDSLNTHSHGGQAKTRAISSIRANHGSREKELKNSRFHKPSTNQLGQRNDKFMISTGQVKKGMRNNIFLNSKGQENQKRKRSNHLMYTEKEILQWREERKTNYPTTANIEKKAKMLSEMQKDGGSIDANAKIRRRQQLKEILAKQAELGVEVAEIPPGYLSDSQKNCARRHKNKFGRGSFKAKYGRNAELCGDGKQVEVERLDDKTSPRSVLNNRKPTLLQKLLSADMERDKSRLLQVFRFMRMNSFFEHCPEKPLRFPLVIAGDCQGSQALVEEMASANVGIGGYDDDDENDGVGDVGAQDDQLGATVAVIKEEQKISDILGDRESDQEEGEIID